MQRGRHGEARLDAIRFVTAGEAGKEGTGMVRLRQAWQVRLGVDRLGVVELGVAMQASLGGVSRG